MRLKLIPLADPDDVHFYVWLVSGGHQYAISFTEKNRRAAIDQCARWARSKYLPFTWVDCIELQFRIREQCPA